MEKDNLLQHLIKSWEDSPYPSFKISSYFPAYVELFGHLVNTKCVFIETGILDGGSLFMWRNWLGPDARIIGIDLNPKAIKWRESGFEIFIGDQGDPEFWKKTLKEIGEFDALLDDGGHQSFQQIVTAIETIKMATKDCVIAIEDTACSFMKDFSAHGPFTFLEYAKDATDILTGRSTAMYENRFPRYAPGRAKRWRVVRGRRVATGEAGATSRRRAIVGERGAPKGRARPQGGRGRASIARPGNIAPRPKARGGLGSPVAHTEGRRTLECFKYYSFERI